MSQGPEDDASARFPAESLGFQVGLTAKAMRALLDARLAEQGVTFSTWVVLIVLATQGGQIQRHLADAVDVEGPTMVRRLDQLEAAGLVERSPVPEDRRATRITLTEHGRRLYQRVRTAVQEAEAELLAGLDPQAVATTRRVLQLLVERARTLRQP
jgi:MarR family transcriptional regulator for hemolysin